VTLRFRAVPKLLVDMKAGMSSVEAPANAVALWGAPTILAKGPTELAYNVLMIVVQGLRADVSASFHDEQEDANRRQAKRPPLEALLPKTEGITPAIDDLARRGVRFTHAYANGTWARPSTVALLAGARSSEIGLDARSWGLGSDSRARFYAAKPPLLPRLLASAGAETRAFVNNPYLIGYAGVGIDVGFDRIDDVRYRAKDTPEIASHASLWMTEHAKDRFFVFCEFRSPRPQPGPHGSAARMYLAEAAKDDEAIGVLMRTLDDLHLRERTLVIVTADHGEALLAEHAVPHALGNYDEAARVPIMLSLPSVLPEGKEVKARVRAIDIAPTVLELLGRAPVSAMSGASLLPLVRGETEPDERVVLTEGRGSWGLLSGKWRLVVREKLPAPPPPSDKPLPPLEELFDLEEDPGERHNLATERPEVLSEMKARLAAAQQNVPVAGTRAATKSDSTPSPAEEVTLHLRFAGAGLARRVSGLVELVDGKSRIVSAGPSGAPPEAVRLDGRRVEIALTTAADAVMGIDVRTHPADAAIRWELFMDDAPITGAQVFAGPFGFTAPALLKGMAGDEARRLAKSPIIPEIDPKRDLGVFVTRE
jgi:arylsulfatase A-like enzyme